MIISKICNFYVTLSSYINIGLFIELIHVIFELFLYDFLGYNKSQDKRIWLFLSLKKKLMQI